jgi:hypothetical protein
VKGRRQKAANLAHKPYAWSHGAAARAKGVKARIKTRDAKFGDAAGG